MGKALTGIRVIDLTNNQAGPRVVRCWRGSGQMSIK